MNERYHEQKLNDKPAATLPAGSADGANPEKLTELRSDDNAGEKAAFGFSEPYRSSDTRGEESVSFFDADEEEGIPVSGSLNESDAFIAGEQSRNDPFAELEENKETLDLADDDPFDPYRQDEFARENGLSRELEDSRTEFGAELAPTPTGPVLLPPQRDGSFQATDNGGLVETADADAEPVPDLRSASGWISIILAVASLFYWPAVLGPAAVVGGIIAYFLGNRSLGAWSAILGVIAVIAHLFLIPYVS